MKIKAKTDFTLNGTKYIVGDEIKVDNMYIIRKLNERGYIEPLNYRDLVLIERELKKEEK